MAGLLAILSFISVLLLSYQLLKPLLAKDDYMSRLRRYTNVEEIRDDKKREKKKESGLDIRSEFFKGIGKIKFLSGYKKKVQVSLTKAHLLLKAEEFIMLNLILFCFFTAFILLVRGVGQWPLAFLAGIIGWILPSLVVKSKIKKRARLLNEQLADALSMMSNSLKTGYSFFQAIDMVAEEMNGPIAEEFAVFKKEVNLGQNTEKAFENMIARVSSEDLELVITAVLIQRQVGGNLSEVLDNITETIRDRVRIKGELKTITAQGKISGIVISLLPVILCFVIYLINPTQMSMLFTRPLGQAMIAVAVVMELTGIILIRKVVRIEM